MAIHGLIGKKIGTTQFFREDGRADCVTAIYVGPCTVTQIKRRDTDGYESVQLGYEPVGSLTKPEAGHLKDAGQLFRHLRELSIDDISEVEVGQTLDVSLFEAGERVEVTGNSKGRGFAGGVKRHHFHGGPKTHGQSDRHRAPGSIGAGTTPGRVLKGLRMAGHMGDAQVTQRSLEVIQSDAERNLLLVKGSIPGARNSLVIIRKAGYGRS
ncbi:MAG: 50S ribosomal protein L3 [Chloroflexi bacterium]|nr:50S ribosomal protein L3 [Chloroflexota bacterium]MCH9038102.1 50S ribosomal protein L3 [Chloroflexota bacterium]MCI0770303.1 50S ribosomal protein L3 [Chloroflexota bacterium]MCI0790463.1 50S ribosomal protein L3 [Chloroflexota bacterium]MCI0795705.1 50S ribosomal protein L3 [Chloroflexota bacterium]